MLRVGHVEEHVGRRHLGVALKATVGFVVHIQPRHGLVADGAGIEGKAQVSLVIEDGVALGQAEIAAAQDAVGGTAGVAVVGVDLDPVDRRRRADAHIAEGGAAAAGAGFRAVGTGGIEARRRQHREVVGALPAQLVGQQCAVVEVVLQAPGQRGGFGLLGVQAGIAVPIAAFDAGHALAIGAAQDRQAAVRGVVIFLVEEINKGPGRRRQSQGQGGGNAPAVVIYLITLGHLTRVLHQVDTQGAGVIQLVVDIGRQAFVTVSADPGRDPVGIPQMGLLAHQVDAATHRRNARLDGAGALEHFGLLQVEHVVAAGHARVAHAIDCQALLGGKTANGKQVAPAQVALPRHKGDTRHIAQNVLQALGVLLLEHLLRHDGDALRGIEQRGHDLAR